MYKRRVRLGDVIKRLVLLTMAGVIAVGVGAKVYAGYRVRNVLDEAVTSTAPIGDLRYLDVDTTFDGKIRVKGLSFYPSEEADMNPLIAEEAVILTPGMLYLLGFEGGPIPKSMGISLLGMWVDLSDLSGFGGSTGGSLSGNPFEALGCGDVDSFQAPDLEKMGYPTNLRMDLHLRYEFAGDYITLVMEQSSLDVAGFKTEFVLTTPGLEQAPLNQSPSDLKLARAKYEMSSSDFNRRRNRFCAENAGITPEEFLDRNVEQAILQLQRRGVIPAADLTDHYRAYMQGDGSWILQTRPEPPVGVTDFLAFDVDQMMEWLSIQSTVAGQPPAVVRFEEFALVEDEEDGDDDQGDALTAVVDQRIAVAKKVDPWVEIPINSAAQVLRNNVNISTTRGKSYRGFLVEVKANEVVIETRVPGGDATVPIPKDQIATFKIRQSLIDRRAADAARAAEAAAAAQGLEAGAEPDAGDGD